MSLTKRYLEETNYFETCQEDARYEAEYMDWLYTITQASQLQPDDPDNKDQF